MTELVWWLLFLQAVLGLIDVIVHHELLCHLAFRISARRELRLHGVRNLCYALVYLLIACSMPEGIWAWFVLALLLGEVFITFWDWYEEDHSRVLPPTERALHGLLTVNFGVLMCLLVPIVWGWAQQPTAIDWISYGVWTVLFVAAAVGVALFGIKDLVAARRLDRWALKPTLAELKLVQNTEQTGRSLSILVTGATGLIGRRLVPAWVQAGHSVTVLTRRPAVAAELATPLKIITTLDQLTDRDLIDGVVHLAGEPIAGGLWSKARKDYLLESRTEFPRAIGAWLARTERKPALWLNASAIGFYGVSRSPDTAFDETAGTGVGFAAQLCRQIEASAAEQATACRLVNMRIGLVLATDGGYLGQLLPPVDLFAGVILGDGQQWQSWIHRDDAVRAIDHCLHHPTLSGPVNLVAPEPIRAKPLMRALGRKLARPVMLHVPAFLLRAIAGELADELLLASQKVLPERLLQAGFEFHYEQLDEALESLL